MTLYCLRCLLQKTEIIELVKKKYQRTMYIASKRTLVAEKHKSE